MRICYLADGRYIHTQRWMSYFKKQGHQVHLVSFAPMEPQHIRAIEELGGVYHGQLGGFHLKRFWLTLRDLSWLVRLLRREKMEVLHCHFLNVNAWYAALSRFRPLVITVMGGGDVCGPDWQPQGARERLLTPYALRRADLVTSWSRVMADVVRPYCRKTTPVEVIHGGIDLARFHPGPKPEYLLAKWNLPPEAKVVFSPRLMRPLSNIDRIAAAARIVCTQRPDTYFLFAAPGEERDEVYEAKVRDEVARAGVGERVRFIGPIPHAEMADHHRLADVTISIPSTDGTPMTVLESMACGTPVIAGAIPDYDSYYFEPEQTVLSANPQDAGEIGRALLRVLGEPELAARLVAEARRRVVAKGSYEAQMSHMEQLYENLFDLQLTTGRRGDGVAHGTQAAREVRSD